MPDAADGLPAQRALAHRRLAVRAVAETRDAGVWLTELPLRVCVNLRAQATPEVRTVLSQHAGCGLPVQPLESARRGALSALWLGPGEWLLVGGSDDLGVRLEAAFRGHFVTVTHAKQGTTVVEGSRFRLSRTPAVVTHGGPTYGEHTFEVLSEVLGYDVDRIADLAAAELFE